MSPVHDADPPQPADEGAGSAAPALDNAAREGDEPTKVRRRSPRKRTPVEPAQEGVQAAVPSDDAPPHSEESGPAEVSQVRSTDALAEPATEADGAARKARRNRRRGRKGRGPRDEDGAMPGGHDAAGPGSSSGDRPARGQAMQGHVLPLAMPDASALFETVTSGAFDSDTASTEVLDIELPAATASEGQSANADGADAAASSDATSNDAPSEAAVTEAADAAMQEPAKRVLLPDAEAPKLQKVLAQAGVGSRRDLEQMIIDQRVTVNGEPAHTGQRVSWGDRVAVDGKPVRVRIAPLPTRVIAYHKPAGEVVSHDDPQQRPTVFRRLPRLQQGKWQSVGRLDINTEGLLLFTTSGELANQLMHPRFGVEREYAVRVLGTLEAPARQQLLEGVTIDGHTAAFKSLEEGGGEGVNRWYRGVITEGRNREVRRLFEAVGLTVSRLIRIRYGSVVLPRGLRRGVCVDLAEDDVRLLRRLTGLGSGGPGASGEGGRNARNRRGPRDDVRGQGGTGPRRDDAGMGPPRPEGRPEARPDFRPDRGPRKGPRPDGGPREQRRAPQEHGPRPAAQPSHANQMHGGRQRPQVAFGDAAVHAHEFDEREEPVEAIETAHIPNPLQQTFDQRAIRESRLRRELSDDAPIPNPLQQTYDKRALKENREPRRDVVDDDGPIPNPLQQTYDKRFAQGGGGGGGGAPRHRPGNGNGPQRKAGGMGGRPGGGGQPDPLKTAVGYIGGDAFLRKKSGGGGKPGRGGKGGPAGGGGGGVGGGGGRRGGRGGPGGGGGPARGR